MNEQIVARHWLAALFPKAAPVLATSTVLILARIWNANGAEHSVGAAVLMTVLAAGAAAGVSLSRFGDSTLTAVAYASSGALALCGVAGYADGLPLPLLLWALVTVLAYGLAARTWRTDRHNTTAYERHATGQREERAHIERVETLRSQAQVDVARTGAAYAEALAQALVTRATLPGFDPAALHRAGLPELPTTAKEH